MFLFACTDKNKKAKKALQWLRGKNADVTQEFSEIEKANHVGKNEEMPGYLSLFSKMYSKPLLISMGLMLFQQLSGINAVIFYTVKIFKVLKKTWVDIRIFLYCTLYFDDIYDVCSSLSIYYVET